MNYNPFSTGYTTNKPLFEKRSKRTWFEGQVKNALTSAGEVRLKKRFSPSRSTCSRRNFLSTRIAITNVMSPSGTMYTTVGTAIHEAVQKGLIRDSNALLVEQEFSLPKYKMFGYVDIIAIDPYTRKLFIVDIKTTGKIPKEVPGSYKGQLASYAILTGITDLELLYINRNISNPVKMRSFTVNLEDVLYSTARIYAESVVADRHNILPQKVLKSDKNKVCTFCPYIKQCWGDDLPIELFAGLSFTEQEEEIQFIVDDLINTMPDRLEQTKQTILSTPITDEVKNALLE